MKYSLPSEILYITTQVLFFLVVIVCMILIIAGFFPIKHPWLTSKAVDLLRNAGVDSCTIESVEMTAWKSIELKGISIEVTLDSSCEYRTTISKAIIPVTMFEYLSGRRKVYQRYRVDSRGESEKNVLKPEIVFAAIAEFTKDLKGDRTVTFEDIRFTTKKNRKTVFMAAGGTVIATLSDTKQDRADLRIYFPVMTIAGDGIQEVKSTVLVNYERGIEIIEFSGKYFDGKIRARGAVSLDDVITVSYTIAVEKIDFAYWYSVHVGVGEINGSADFYCKGDAIATDLITKKYDCILNVSECALNGLPMQQSLATSLFIPSLENLKFNRLGIKINKRENADTLFGSFIGSGNNISFSSNGWFLRDGSIHQQITGELSESIVSGFSSELPGILTDSSGNRNFKCRLFGTYIDPRFELDNQTLQRIFGGLLINVQQEINK